MSSEDPKSKPFLGKKSYVPPQVFEYGTLHEITLMVGKNGAVDGGSGSTKNTKP